MKIFLWMVLLLGLSHTAFTQTNISRAIGSDSDDAREKNNGDLMPDENALELGEAGYIGLRFQNISVPSGATIISAYLVMVSDKDEDKTPSGVMISAQLDPDPNTFDEVDYDISSRATTMASVNWNFGDWDKDNSYSSPNLNAVIQEIVDQNLWDIGNNLVLILQATGSEAREARSYEGDPGESAILHISYTGGTSPSELNDHVNNDADLDDTNELNTGFSFSGGQLSITDAGGTLDVDLSGLNDTGAAAAAQAAADQAQSDIDNHISNDLDTDDTNEYNTGASLNVTTLEISDGGGLLPVDLSSLDESAEAAAAQTAADNAQTAANNAQTTANQGVSDAAAAQTAANNAQTTANQGVSDAASAQTTANQGVSDAAAAQTSANNAQTTANQGVSDAAAAQTAINNHITNDLDTDANNEIQDLSLAGNTLSLTDDASTVDLSGYLDNTDTQLTEEEVDIFVSNNGYLTSFSEIDPVYSAAPASGIATGDINNWNTAHSWGDHATAGYLNSLSGAVLTTGAQSISGTKTFNSDAVINGLTAGRGAGGNQFNTAFGIIAMATSNGGNNTAFGWGTLNKNTARFNTAVGHAVLSQNTSGLHNTAIGHVALVNNTTGEANTAIGSQALASNTTGGFNTAAGYIALRSNTTGSENTAYGQNNLSSNTIGGQNTSVGGGAMSQNNSGSANSAFGLNALFLNTNGFGNTGVGYSALINSTTGGTNTAVGFNSLLTNSTGSDNTGIGSGADVSAANLSNATAIGANTIVSQSNSLVLGNNANVGIGTSAPSEKLEVIGKTKTDALQVTTGAGTAGEVLTSDAAGNATWQTIAAGGGTVQGTDANILNIRATDEGTLIGTSRGENSVDLQTSRFANTQVASGQYSTIGGGDFSTASGDWSTVGGGNFNTAAGDWSTISGGTSNESNGDASFVGGGQLNTAGYFAVIVGGNQNNAGDFSSVGGGFNNDASSYSAVIGGGNHNLASGQNTTIGGGESNSATEFNATIGGGESNSASGSYSTIGGGGVNTTSGLSSTVGGGLFNNASGNFATVSGGDFSIANGHYSTIPGGRNLRADSYGEIVLGFFNTPSGGNATSFLASDPLFVIGNGTVSGPTSNALTVLKNGATRINGTLTIDGDNAGAGQAFTFPAQDGTAGQVMQTDGVGNATWQTIAAGGGTVQGTDANTLNIRANDEGSFAGNTRGENSVDLQTLRNNAVQVASGIGSTIGGGNYNRASANAATVGGGFINNATSPYATVGGGRSNNATSSYATTGGGYVNKASGPYSTVGGGRENISSLSWSTTGGGYYNKATANAATVSGGSHNHASSSYATIGGGENNTASHVYSTVGGGERNTSSNSFSTVGGGWKNTASGAISTIGGGENNTAPGRHSAVGGGERNTASGENSTLGGGESNIASGLYSTVGGGVFNRATGLSSTVVGGYANEAAADYSTASGYIIVAGNFGELHNGGNIRANGTILTSDKRYKKDIRHLDNALDKVLQLQGVNYKYKAEEFKRFEADKDKTQIGFIAQDVQKVLPELVSSDGTEEAYLGIRYANMTAVLVEAVKEQQDQIVERDERIAELEAQLALLSEKVDALLEGGRSAQNAVLNDEVPWIEQNAPNPFYNDTEINYFIPASSREAQIIFYDINGRIIQSVDIQEKGKGVLRIKGGTLTPGTYIYKLIVDDTEIDTKKSVFVR